jgi:hypothetical protein
MMTQQPAGQLQQKQKIIQKTAKWTDGKHKSKHTKISGLYI